MQALLAQSWQVKVMEQILALFLFANGNNVKLSNLQAIGASFLGVVTQGLTLKSDPSGGFIL